MGHLTMVGNATWPEEYPILSSSQTNLSSTSLYPPDPLPPVAIYYYPFSENMEVPEPEVIYPNGYEQQANVFIDVNASYYEVSSSSVSEQDTSNHPFCPVGITNTVHFEDVHSNSNVKIPTIQQQVIVDSDTMEIWFNVPNGLEPDEWNSFFASFTN
ncbi:hypothetical protein BDQ17DRAFT_1433621 [Cyathus striatus]|nr:hypothetical protein BDQ17DRAFT_1433621 [Cyathus striatus]